MYSIHLFIIFLPFFFYFDWSVKNICIVIPTSPLIMQYKFYDTIKINNHETRYARSSHSPSSKQKKKIENIFSDYDICFIFIYLYNTDLGFHFPKFYDDWLSLYNIHIVDVVYYVLFYYITCNMPWNHYKPSEFICHGMMNFINWLPRSKHSR